MTDRSDKPHRFSGDSTASLTGGMDNTEGWTVMTNANDHAGDAMTDRATESVADEYTARSWDGADVYVRVSDGLPSFRVHNMRDVVAHDLRDQVRELMGDTFPLRRIDVEVRNGVGSPLAQTIAFAIGRALRLHV